MKSYITALVTVLFVSCLGLSCFAACPSADLTEDCFVDFEDFAIMAGQWLTESTFTDLEALASQWLEGIPEIDSMVWVSINDPGVSGHAPFNGDMSKYKTTNAQYCQFLNAALASGDITVSGSTVYGANGSHSGADFAGQVYYDLAGSGLTYNGATNGSAARIHYSGSVFTVDGGFENHPVSYVSWYGATAFCNYYSYRLPTEWEWQAVADYDGSYIYGCGTTINNSMANYLNSSHPDGTTVVGAFGTYGYGMCDMAGNVWEWTSTVSGSNRVFRGGSWNYPDNYCAVSFWSSSIPYNTYRNLGFRVCRDNVIPNVTGMSQAEAEASIVAASLVVGTITHDYHATIPSGNVISSEPVAGTKVNAGSAVNLLISMGPAIIVPNVTNMPQSEAQASIVAASLVVGIITHGYHAAIPSGNVISSEPVAGSTVNVGSAVNLLISMGPAIIVPNVTNMPQSEAQASIVAASLVVGTITHGYHAAIPSGNVISSEPVAGSTVNIGSAVNLLISMGPAIIVPNVTNMPQSEAQAAIAAAGLVVGTLIEAYSGTVAVGNIISQNPPAGEEVLPGSTVNLVISKGEIPGMVWVSINDPGVSGHEGFAGQMNKYETTNAQYCEFLNAALATGDITVGADNVVYGASGSNSGADFESQPYFRTFAVDSSSQITYSGGTFSVRSRDGHSMADHPVVMVSWYGSTAFCNYYGYRLPTEWEWQAVADYDGSYTYGCGTTISKSKANYYDNGYANPLGLNSEPYTSPVGNYPAYGYGMCDMAGNVFELTSSCYYSDCNHGIRVLRGGGWCFYDSSCAVSYRYTLYPGDMNNYSGFRVCR